MAIALTPADKERIRYHLGYLNIEASAAIQLGFPRGSQAQFLVEQACERLMEATVGGVSQIVSVLDRIEGQMIASLTRLTAQQLGELKLRNSNEEATEGDLLEREYRRWAQRLADNLGVPLNVYSERFREGSGAEGMNIPVVG